MEKIPVYFMPGLAASPAIFDNIKLPEHRFDCYYLKWLLPESVNEPLPAYAARIAEGIKHDNAVLIGVSFGGIIVQEMAKLTKVRKVVIISSVRCNGEFPRRMRLAKSMKMYHLFPTKLMENLGWFSRFATGNSIVVRKLDLYDKFMSVRDKKYLDWAFRTIINWDCTEPNKEVIHLHGDADEVFPVRYLQDFIPIPQATHVAILTKGKWLSDRLPQLIEDNVTIY